MRTSVAALEENFIEAETKIEDTGEIRIKEFRYGNWYYDQYGKKEAFLTRLDQISKTNFIQAKEIVENIHKKGLHKVDLNPVNI